MRKYPLSALFLLIAPALPARAEEPRVAVTVKPLHSLVAGVMEGAGEPWLLAQGEASPHDAALRPSDALRLKEARLVFYIGRDFDGYLLKPIKGKALPPQVALERKGISADPHLWLDPDEAMRVADEAAAALSAAYPAHAGRFAANAGRMRGRIAAMAEKLALRLKDGENARFAVSHDAYGPFVRHFGLRDPEAISAHPDSPPRPARFSALRARVKAGEIRCILAEPHGRRMAERLAIGTPARVVDADPEGRAIPPGPELYFTLMEGLAESFARCLSGP